MVSPAPAADAARDRSDEHLPRVGVVVLNWNSGWFTRRCLRSVAALDYPEEQLRVVLVDNGSVDGSLEELEAWLARPGAPDVELLRNGANLGFAEGCNRAMRELLRPGAEGVEHVALLNNDAWAEPGWLRAMVRVMTDHRRCAGVSCRLLLEPGFVPVDVEAASEPLVLESVMVGRGAGPRLQVAGRVRAEGFSDEGALVWPPRRIWRLDAPGHGRLWVPMGDDDGQIEVRLRDDGGVLRTIARSAGAERTRLLNGIGTGLNESGEGFDIGYGEPDPAAGAAALGGSDVVAGFCGGAALLRGSALEQVGLFDPLFFAYYEDTDLSWRLRNAGWELRTAPLAVAHHAFGASGGSGSRWHVFLDRRNWLLTNLRNGDRTAVRRALGWLRRASWRLFRVNIFGRARRGRPIQAEPLRTWMRAVASAVARLGRLRAGPRPGERPTDRVRSRLQPSGSPAAPQPWPGGPLVVYLDVGETIKAGYRAGIQRVVCALVAELAVADPRIELVPIRWCTRNERFRRISAAEYASLLRSGRAPEPSGDTATVAGAKRRLRRVLGRLGVLGALRRRREQLFGREQRAVEDSLVLDRLEPGGVLLEVDAVWNEVGVDRDVLLSELRAADVHVAAFVHDLLPIEEPDWFAPALRGIFERAARAQLRHCELVICASEATRSQVERVSSEMAIDPPPIATVPLGADHRWSVPGRGRVRSAVQDARYLLVVGTLEPRKNQGLALEVFDRLRIEYPDLQLVLAGRFGWGVEDLVAELDSHPLRGTRLHWFDDAHDDELDQLYRDAFVVLVPSRSEGFGLPVLEALVRGTPVVASAGGALQEAGSSAVTFVGVDDLEGWISALHTQLSDPEARAAALAAARGFPAPQWSRTAMDVATSLLEAFAVDRATIDR